MTTTMTITYKAFSNNERPITSATFEIPTDIDVWNYEGWLDVIYEVTNLQSEIYDFTRNVTKLQLWNLLQPLLPANRTHTSLSVGDEVTINNNTYRCDNIGWQLLTTTTEKENN